MLIILHGTSASKTARGCIYIYDGRKGGASIKANGRRGGVQVARNVSYHPVKVDVAPKGTWECHGEGLSHLGMSSVAGSTRIVRTSLLANALLYELTYLLQ